MPKVYWKSGDSNTFTGIDAEFLRLPWRRGVDLKPQISKAAERSHAAAAQETALMPAFGSLEETGVIKIHFVEYPHVFESRM